MSKPPPALSDLDVYRTLLATADALDQAAAQAVSLVGEATLQTAALNLRGMAQVVYEHSLEADTGGMH